MNIAKPGRQVDKLIVLPAVLEDSLDKWVKNCARPSTGCLQGMKSSSMLLVHACYGGHE
jgi:hypothetical protein